jgi:preprotein translocase subunit YajC
MIDKLNLYQNWPVYLLLGAFVTFVVYMVINSRQQERKKKESQKADEKKE